MSGALDLSLVALVALMVGVVGTGIAVASHRHDADRAGARRLALAVVSVIVAWLLATAALAELGVLSVWTARPPRVLLLPITAFATLMLLSRSRSVRELIQSTPPAWPIAAQSFRVAVELALFGLYLDGRAPVQVTFEGRNLDILAGVTAPVVAVLVARGRISPALILAWNALGLLLLGNIVGTAATSLPGPLHLDWPGEPFLALATWPVMWIPAFLAPLAVFLHVVSIRQTVGLVARSRERQFT